MARGRYFSLFLRIYRILRKKSQCIQIYWRTQRINKLFLLLLYYLYNVLCVRSRTMWLAVHRSIFNRIEVGCMRTTQCMHASEQYNCIIDRFNFQVDLFSLFLALFLPLCMRVRVCARVVSHCAKLISFTRVSHFIYYAYGIVLFVLYSDE